jgi:uncharacterized protein
MSTIISTPTDAELKSILEETKTIAVIGWSDKEDRPSHEVSRYLRKQGYKIIPVNPRLEGKDWDGQPIYACVTDIPESVDMADVFRRPEYTPHHAERAVAAGVRVFWLQLGIVNEEARRIAEEGGMIFVQDRCTQIEHMRLIRGFPMPTAPAE